MKARLRRFAFGGTTLSLGGVTCFGATLLLLACVAGPLAGVAQAEACPNEGLRSEQPYGLSLPDCRAYELASPVNKDDNDAVNIVGAELEARASVSGEALTYVAQSSFAEPSGARLLNSFISKRGESGWSTRDVTPPLKSAEGAEGGFQPPYAELTFTPDLSKGVVKEQNFPLTGDAPAGFIELYLADLDSGSYRLISEGVQEGEAFLYGDQPKFQGASVDLSHVVFLPSEAPSSGLEEWNDGRLTPVGVTNTGEPLAAVVGAPQAFSYSNQQVDRWRAVSADASRVFMTSDGEEGRFARQVYMRENTEQPQSPVNGQGVCTNSAQACTVMVSASQKTNGGGPGGSDPNGPLSARFWAASEDGARVFFTSCAKLTNDATAVAEAAEASQQIECDSAVPGIGNDLYEYDVQSGTLVDLTVDANAGDATGAAVRGVVATSEDGSYLYFVAEGVLAGGAVSGEPNLYLRHGGQTRFITTLAPGSGGPLEPGGDESDWSPGPAGNTVASTPDGRHLAFGSELSLTGYDNHPAEAGQCPGRGAPERCLELFSYSADSGSLTCVSCNPSGARPRGPSSLYSIKVQNAGQYKRRNFSSDGSRLFFQSQDALIAHDTNGVQDVYELEDGQVHPISNVVGGTLSYFMDASPSGEDVFIATASQLTLGDPDFRVDVYDAKVGGGFPETVPAVACDNGDSCKPPAAAQPAVFGAPPSATFSGAGNLAPPATVKAPVTSVPKSLTRARKLATALRACRKHARKQRSECESRARAKYGAKPKSKPRSKPKSKSSATPTPSKSNGRNR